MRRHYTNYFRGLPNIKHYRSQLVGTMLPDEIFSILDQIVEEYNGYEFGEAIYEMDANMSY
jgi:hypothetical protein